MAINYPGPYEIEYVYNSPLGGLTLPHYMRVNCVTIGTPAVGTPLASISFQTIGGTPVAADVAVATLWDWVRSQLSNAVTVSSATLFKYTPGTFAKTFITAYAGSLPAGISGSSPGDSHYMMQTYRTAGGNTMKLMIMEDINPTLKNRTALISNPAGSADQQLAAYVLSTAGWMLGRDDSFPVAGLNQIFGEDEATFKARHR